MEVEIALDHPIDVPKSQAGSPKLDLVWHTCKLQHKVKGLDIYTHGLFDHGLIWFTSPVVQLVLAFAKHPPHPTRGDACDHLPLPAGRRASLLRAPRCGHALIFIPKGPVGCRPLWFWLRMFVSGSRVFLRVSRILRVLLSSQRFFRMPWSL